jgi:outer membrane protein insertion porin family
MLRIYKTILFTAILFIGNAACAQDTSLVSINPALKEIFESKIPKKYTIKNIEVFGNRSFDRNLIISISGMAVGDVVNIPGTDAFNKAIVKLWKQNLVADAEINITNLEGDNISLEILITERPRLIDYNFIGVKKGEKDDLSTKCALAKDRVLTEDMKLSAVDIIKKFYYGKGYGKVEVNMVESVATDAANGVVLNFYINKGNKVKINSINFANNNELSDAKLKKQMKGTKEMMRLTLYPDHLQSPYGDTARNPTFNDYVKETGYLQPIKTKDFLEKYFRVRFSGSKFSETKYGEDKEKLLDYYNAEGFRDATIDADTSIINGKGNLDLHIKMNEGHKYYFGNITWKGVTKYSDSILTLILGIKKGDVYNAETLNKRLGKQLSAEGGDIGSLYQNDGYLFFNVDPIETAVYNDTIDFEIQMREGPQATYGKITVSGNDKTKDYVILREMRTIPGEKFSREDIIRTQRELSQLGFLNAEKINPQVVPNNADGTVDINWQVEERSADQVELSAGFGGGIGLTGTLGFTFNNFSLKNITKRSSWDPLPSGDGQKLSIRAQSNGRQYRSYNFSFTEPWLGGKKRNSFSLSYFNTKFANAFDEFRNPCKACAKTSYLKSGGFGISLGKQLKWPDDFFNLVYSLNVQQYKLKNYNTSGFGGLSNGTSTNLSLKVTLLRNSAGPNPLFPTSGSNLLLSGQFTLPYSLVGITDANANVYKLPEFHKWRFNSEWYVPIGRARGVDKNKQFILKIAAKYGLIGRYNTKLQISPFERFQVGGSGLSNNQAILGFDNIALRGYKVFESSNTKINPTEDASPAQNFAIFNKYTAELRYPFSTSASSTIYGHVFFEAGNGWYNTKEFNPFKLRRTVGVGARFFLPMFGLLGFDYGIGLDRYNQNTGLKGAGNFTFLLGQEPE